MSNIAKLRDVLVYNQPKQKFHTFQTATDKWSEIAEMIKNTPELEVANLDAMRAVVASTQNTLELPNALIPEGNQKIFLFEAKVKSGAIKKAPSPFDQYTYNDLRKLAKDNEITGLGSNPLRDDLITALEKKAGIKRTISSKQTKTGRTIKKKVVNYPDNMGEIERGDKAKLANQPTLSDRVKSLELGFKKFILGMKEIATDYVKPKPEKFDKISKKDLEKEAKTLVVK